MGVFFIGICRGKKALNQVRIEGAGMNIALLVNLGVLGLIILVIWFFLGDKLITKEK